MNQRELVGDRFEGLVVQHLTVARVADGLGVSWNTANNAVLAEGQHALIDDPTRFDRVAVIGVDEHVWKFTRRGDKYVRHRGRLDGRLHRVQNRYG